MGDTLTVGLVVVAAGMGTRFGGLKQLAPLGGETLLTTTLKAFDSLGSVTKRVVVISPELESDPAWQAIHRGPMADWLTVHGGRTRAESVRNGVEALGDTIDVVAVHDGARPFPPVDGVQAAIDRLSQYPSLAGVILASPMTDTVKRVGNDGCEIVCTVERSQLARAETPQVCRRTALLEALHGDRSVTDESHALELAGFRTEVLLHGGWNPKITVPSDLAIAEAWLAARGRRP
jgi:2-C-methyl-D-erythritol 4-phosphate cytidylyltransferase